MNECYSKDKIYFKHKDPSIICTGPHDYEVYYGGCFIGILSFSAHIPTICSSYLSIAVFISKNVLYNTGLKVEDLDGITSNDELLEKAKSSILNIITHNDFKIK